MTPGSWAAQLRLASCIEVDILVVGESGEVSVGERGGQRGRTMRASEKSKVRPRTGWSSSSAPPSFEGSFAIIGLTRLSVVEGDLSRGIFRIVVFVQW